MPVFPHLPPHVAEILTTLEDAGHRACAVGGCVRDALLGLAPHDWDVTTDAVPSEIMALFPRTVPTGAKYGTVTVLTEAGGVEVTTFRADGAYLDSRRPESVGFSHSLEEDLLRRDFTVNALAMDRRGVLTDVTGGLEDLRRRALRGVGDPWKRFQEDALRMLRAVRFTAQLGFTMEPETLAALRELAPLAAKLSAERVREELQRTLATPKPEVVRELVDDGLLDAFPVRKGADIPWERLREVPEELRLGVFALLCAEGEPAALTRALRCPAALTRDVEAAPALEGDSLSVRLALSACPTPAVLLAAGAGGFYALAEQEAHSGRFVRPPDLALSGRELRALGLKGPQIGETLRALALRVTAGELPNEREALLEAARRGFSGNK